MNKEFLRVYIEDVSGLQDKAAWTAAYNRLPKYRQEKADAFLFMKDKLLSIGVWLLLEKALEEIGVASYDISYGKNDKPYLTNLVYDNKCNESKKQLFFNLSHSEEKVMCVVSDREVGCDVEKVIDVDLEIAHQFFTIEEYREIMSFSTKEQQNDYFFRLWTLKESYMKMTGLGMELAPNSFRMEQVKSCSTDGGWAAIPDIWSCHFREFDYSDGYKYAVCIANDIT